ncbi:NFU1 iron-sulfur cluster scaffold homolog, mitochondrial [Marchantia polymorpha subsp. ruderalis]|uniref:Scaffold protein Nfu/NifU N-terminal domain-containing protein n=2 Tax=Marchantia polymorpha TaxID=3197 RepID=A0A176WNW8_MARPO|nr:hypothetical protein AXG93_1757s1120 [Marchantia polymorpha subsp. ruderalis]PTQ46645.1 hypothetical protein MARPO_0010s0052 [Marchantia polymorpha]BBN12927.1 hypothetical protein Mp_5g24040 [Marchantia polymorpha subsp. ruderalis]|eukprot:PTQ46645.1 hypothetical protein MARPO_0010s0052 [Marchantia polymorpha]
MSKSRTIRSLGGVLTKVLVRRSGAQEAISRPRFSSSWTGRTDRARLGFTVSRDGALQGIALPSTSFVLPGHPFEAMQRRSMFIQTQSTPNPSSLMFFPGKPVMEVGSSDFPNARVAMGSPLAKALFRIDGVTRVFFGADFVSVTKIDDMSWDILKPEIFAAIMDFYTSKEPLFYDARKPAASDTAIHEDDDETVAMIKELLETRVRPAVQDDGGDIEFHGFDEETGIVKLKMQGACSGCPSSAVTLKNGIENMLMHYVPEVKGVEEVLESEDDDDAAGVSSSPTA